MPVATAREVVDRCRILAGFSQEPSRTTRTFLSPPMRDVHAYLGAWMQRAGMSVRVDDAGNLRGVYPASSPGRPRLFIGSHLDTVPNAGAFDGVLGVVLAIPVFYISEDLPEIPDMLTFVVSAAPPPPPPPPPAPAAPAATPSKPKVTKPVQRTTPRVAPVEAPREIVEETYVDLASEEGILDGVEGGIPGGVVGGFIADLPQPPPPPPPSSGGVPSPNPPCNQNAPVPAEGAQAWVTVPNPARRSITTLCVRLIIGGNVVVGAQASGVAHYKTTDTAYGPQPAGSDGVAALQINVGGPTPGYTVEVDVTVSANGQTHRTQTNFTPQ